MGCNGWNHSPNCDCGWGGEFYESGSSNINSCWQNFLSYTIPNAQCPYCGEKVFFYRSPFNGSVYFDDLGPPWPKHPCMDAENIQVEKFQVANLLRSRVYSELIRRENGWLPVICVHVQRHKKSKSTAMIKLISKSGISKTFYAQVDREKIDYRTPFLFRTISKNLLYEISTLNVHADVPYGIKFYASTSLIDLKTQLEIISSRAKKQSAPRNPEKVKKISISDTKNVKIKQNIPRPKITVAALPVTAKKKKRKKRTFIKPADVPVTYRKPAVFPKKSDIS